jgi:membrane protein DedA with SNARE-associated domain
MDYFFSIFFGTFILEDVAMAASIALVGKHKISLFTAFIACFLGISAGDLGLYIIGRGIANINFDSWYGKYLSFLKKFASYKPSQKAESILSYSIVLSRFVPGTRIPTYVGAGLLKYSFIKFFVLTIISVASWVLFVLLGGSSIYALFKGNLVLALVGLVFLLMYAKFTIP